MRACVRCWLASLPYVMPVMAAILWWHAWPEAKPTVVASLSHEAIERSLLHLDGGRDEDSGVQVTLIPAPNFAEISLSEERKQSFIAWMLPMIAQENHRILSLREQAAKLYGVSQQERLSLKQKEWLVNVATDFGVDVDESGFDMTFWQNLFHRVDAIPPSLVLAQAAAESGWGTSRLAKDVNNYFGIMCFSKGCGVPYVGAGEYRRFTDAQHAVSFYMSILNTKGAYRAARSERMRQRLIGEVPSGAVMVKTLVHYSELGQRYIQFVLRIMQENRLDEYDGANIFEDVEIGSAELGAPLNSKAVSPVVTPLEITANDDHE